MKNPQNKYSKLIIPAIMCATLGLAPFFPEPHVVKQINNILGGTFTKPMDWFDLLMHGSPWVYFIVVLITLLKPQKSSAS